mgnify:FL=1
MRAPPHAFWLSFDISLAVDLPDQLEGLLVGDHALVDLLHLEGGQGVEVRLCALSVALWQRHLIEQVGVH